MILRKLVNAIQRQDWFTVLVEIVIVMMGILLGLQVNAWNQARIDRGEETVFLKALYQDIIELEKNSKLLVATRIDELIALENAADILYGKTPWRQLTAIECGAIVTSHIAGIVPTSLPSWHALRDAGRTSILSNAELKLGLATLTQKRESLDRIMNLAENVGYDLLSTHPDLFVIQPIRSQLKEASERIYYTTETTCDSEAFSKNRMAMNALAFNMNRFSSVINRFGVVPWVEQVTRIRLILEAASKNDP